MIKLAVHFFKMDSWAFAGGCYDMVPTQCGLGAMLGQGRRTEGLIVNFWLILCTGLV